MGQCLYCHPRAPSVGLGMTRSSNLSAIKQFKASSWHCLARLLSFPYSVVVRRESGEALSGSVFKSRPHTSGQLRIGRILIAHSQVKDT